MYVLQGIVVKVINKGLGEKFYKKKGVVEVSISFYCVSQLSSHLAELTSHYMSVVC